MLFTVVILMMALFGACLLFYKTGFSFSQMARIKSRLQREGTEADAVLLNIEQTGFYVNNQPQVKLQLQVQPPIGRNFVSEALEVLSPIDISQLRIGGALKVKYNRANTKEVTMLRNETTASFTLHKNTTP